MLGCAISYLDGTANALEEVRHIERQHHILLQQTLRFLQPCYVFPPHARTLVHHIPGIFNMSCQGMSGP